MKDRVNEIVSPSKLSPSKRKRNQETNPQPTELIPSTFGENSGLNRFEHVVDFFLDLPYLFPQSIPHV